MLSFISNNIPYYALIFIEVFFINILYIEQYFKLVAVWILCLAVDALCRLSLVDFIMFFVL